MSDRALEDAALATVNFLRDMRDKKPAHWLTLIGNPGTGKTHLAKSVTRISQVFLAKMEYVIADCAFYSWPKVADLLRSGDYEIIDEIIGRDFAAIDDIGAERTTDFIGEKMFRVLDGRLNKWTMITSNLEKEQLDARAFSRMNRNNSQVVEILTGDYALRK